MARNRTDAVWRALSDPNRRRLLDLMRDRPRTTGELCRPFRLSRFAVMKHLAVLASAGLVVVRRRGRERWNHLNAVPIRQIYERWVSGYAAAWAESLVGLQRVVEGQQNGASVMAKINVATHEVVQELQFRAPRKKVFTALTRDIGKWWAYRGREGSSMSVEPQAGGRFYEEFPVGGGFLWGTVFHAEAPQTLKVFEAPGSTAAIMSHWSFELEERDGGTLLKFTHHIVAGPDFDPKCTRDGWGELLDKYLRAYVDDGKTFDKITA